MKTLLLLTLTIFCASCHKWFPDDELTLEKRPYYGNQLRLDGYYYKLDTVHNTIVSTHFFYRNGVIYHGGSCNSANCSFRALEEMFSKNAYVGDRILWWGVFNIDGDKIAIERWYPSSGGGAPAYIRSGKILNDTTFIITKSFRPKTGEESIKNETFHFRHFPNKPDSTNIFVK